MHLTKKHFFFIMLFSIFSQILPSDGHFKRKSETEKSEETPAKRRRIELACNFGSCNEAFQSAFKLACHQRDIHHAKVDPNELKGRENKPSLFCIVCKKTLENIKQQSELKHHLENDHAFCMLCNKVCQSTQGTTNGLILLKHMTTAHPERIMALTSE